MDLSEVAERRFDRVVADVNDLISICELVGLDSRLLRPVSRRLATDLAALHDVVDGCCGPAACPVCGEMVA